MAMILDAFMSKFSELLVQMVQDEVGMLLGVPGEIEKLQHTVRDIQCVIADAEKRQTESMAIKSWLVQLKDVMYDADDIVDLCQIKAEERLDRSDSACGFLHFLSCLRNPIFAHKIGTKIKDVNLRLGEIANRRRELGLNVIQTVVGPPPVRRVNTFISGETDPLVVMKDIVGEKIEEDTGLLVSWLTEEGNGVRGNIVVVAIVGMGGIGKTILAKRVFNDTRVEKFELKIWACVSKEVKAVELLKSIIREAGGEPGAAQKRSQLLRTLEGAIRGKKFFLVLDDVWPESVAVWDDLLRAPMSAGAHGSKLLVTTRDERVANVMRATRSHSVEKMSNEDGWTLLSKQVFQSEAESDIQGFKLIGLDIVKKCGGLPLAIKNIGGILRMKNKMIGEWKTLLRSNLWSMDGLPNGIHQAFYLSYEDLPSALKQCFILCSLYPEDYEFEQTELICLWFAEGFLQGFRSPWELGKEYYEELLLRNLLEDSGIMYDNTECKMHDLLRSFAHHLGKDENYILTKENKNFNRHEYIPKLRRLSIEKIEVNLQVVKREKWLRTLLIDDIPENALVDLCTNFPYLRILDMSCSNISTLPNSLSSLVHLRYLNVSNSEITDVPESIGFLRNLVYLDFTCCKGLLRVPNKITNLVKLMFISFLGTSIEGIPKGLRSLEKLKELHGFRSSENSLKMFCSLDELQALSHLVLLSLVFLEKVTNKNIAKEAKLWCKGQLQDLTLRYTKLSWQDQVSQTNEKKATVEGVLNELCPPTSVLYLKINGYFGGSLPNWLNLGTALPNLLFLEIRNCNCFVHIAPLGQLPNLNFLRIKGAHSILSVGEEFLWGDVKSRDTTAGSCSVVPAFPKLHELIFERMANWKEWQWNKGESAMPKLKKLFIDDCPQLKSLPQGLVHHATSLEYLEIDGANDLTTIENFPSINEIRVFRNPNLERVSNLSCVSLLLIEDCPNLKTVENLNALQWMQLVDYEMFSLPEYLVSVMPCNLTIDCNDQLLRKIATQREYGSWWHKFKHIPKVIINSEDELLYATYQKTPFSFTTNIC